MKRVNVKFSVTLPVDATKNEIFEWVAFCIKQQGVSFDNPLSPLSTYDLEGDSIEIEIE